MSETQNRRPAKCWRIRFDDNTYIRMYAYSRDECLYCVTNPSTVTSIEEIRKIGDIKT